MNALHEQFVAEARELIHQASNDLIAVEREGASAARIDRILRAFHTLKGAAGVVELPLMASTLHAAEDLLAAIHGGRLQMKSEMIDQALACLDQVSGWVDAFEAQTPVPPQAGDATRAMVAGLRGFLSDGPTDRERRQGQPLPSDAGAMEEWIVRLLDKAGADILRDPRGQPGDVVAISYEPRPACFFDGDDPLALMRALPNLLAFHIEGREPVAPLSDLDPYACNLRLQAIAGGTRADVSAIFRLVPDQVRLVEIPRAVLSARVQRGRDDTIERVRAILAEQQQVLAASPDGDDRTKDLSNRHHAQLRTREREMALRQLHESQKMETIGQLTGGVAHDFNNLLAVILGSLSLLKKNVPEDPRISRLLEGAIQGAERGATLTKRLLAFARRQDLKLEAVEVQKLVPEMLDFLRQSVGPSIAIIVDIQPDVHPVKIDANQLELALMNLAVNARDAMPKGGTLTIMCANETNRRDQLPKTLPSGDFVRLSVTDSGSGMSEATLAKAMEPFFTTKGIGKGTGLGLSMVHGLTAQCGGAMSISSELGKGTVVSLWLPCARPGDAVKPPERYIAPNVVGRRLRILLVDDDPLVSMNTVELLIDLGHSVRETHSAAAALRLLEGDEPFDAVVTDYAMPGMNGLDLALRIKQMKPGLPVILATGYSDLPLHAGHGFARLAKPYSQEELADVLGKALQGSNA